MHVRIQNLTKTTNKGKLEFGNGQTESGDRLKIRVAYTAEERDRKELHQEAVKTLFPDTKVKEAAEKDGFLHTVLTIPIPKNADGTGRVDGQKSS